MPAALFATGRDGTRIYVRHHQGPSPVTAVLCDGIACDGFIWKYLWEDLSRVVSVAHWNYRGHGRSALPVDPAAIDLVEHAHDLEAVRRAIDDPEIVLFGHSMGCQAALEGFRLRREKVRGVVLLCGSSGRITHTFKGTNVMAQVLPSVIARVEAYPEIARAIWSRVPPEIALQVALLTGEVDKAAIRPDDLMPYMKHMVDIDVPMFLRMLRSAGEHSAADLLPQIDVPALVIAGDRDTFTPPQYAEEMAAAMPQAELVMVPGGTHVVPLERKDFVAARLEKFLRERVGGVKLRRALVWAAMGLLAGCGKARREAPSASAAQSTRAVASASAAASERPVVSVDAGARAEESARDPDEELLRRSTLRELVPQRGAGSRPGVFDAVLEAPGGKREAVAEPALAAAPTAYRAPLAFYRLARALGMHVVPVTTVRAVPLAEIGSALDARGGGPTALHTLRVQNDGTVDVLLATRASASAGSPWEAPRGAAVAVDAGSGVATWDRWASAEAPLPGEDGGLLRDYVEMRVLDYLAADLGRNTALRSGHALVLADNAGAFAAHPDGPALDAMLRRIRAFRRFPRGLRDALVRLDRAHVAALFEAGAFEGWLLPPRVLVELDERRASLLTLLEARITERGAEGVLAL